MCRFVLPGVLIVLSVISRCDGAPGQPDLLDQTALGLLANIQNLFEVQRQSEERNVGFCKLCEGVVAQLMALAKKEFGMGITVMCNKAKSLKNNCIKEAKKFEAKAIRLLFHGNNAKESCKHMKLC